MWKRCSSGGCDTRSCLHVAQVLGSSCPSVELFTRRCFLEGRLPTPSPSSTSPLFPRRVSAPAGEQEITRHVATRNAPPRSCEVDQSSAGENTAKCPEMAEIRQVGSRKVEGVCLCADAGILALCQSNVGHFWLTRWKETVRATVCSRFHLSYSIKFLHISN